MNNTLTTILCDMTEDLCIAICMARRWAWGWSWSWSWSWSPTVNRGLGPLLDLVAYSWRTENRDLGLVLDLVANMLDQGAGVDNRLGDLVGDGISDWHSGSGDIDGVGGHGGSSLHLHHGRLPHCIGSPDASVTQWDGLADGINKPLNES